MLLTNLEKGVGTDTDRLFKVCKIWVTLIMIKKLKRFYIFNGEMFHLKPNTKTFYFIVYCWTVFEASDGILKIKLLNLLNIYLQHCEAMPIVPGLWAVWSDSPINNASQMAFNSTPAYVLPAGAGSVRNTLFPQ